ncbi:hypothetical protein CHARACLAT_000375 [Characodon lateralis]|uniref:Uncharacterized protein n=1 Tax=Characodon lateralis TaxID=208331 RepID=A0ABU7DNZ0_9TELE|nr:hypothetical protein [Characodon lateralis]
MVQMQAPKSSEEATLCCTSYPSLLGTLQSWMRWLQSSKHIQTTTKEKINKKKNKFPGFRQVLMFLQTGYIVSFIPVCCSAGLLSGTRGLWTGCRLWLGWRSFGWLLLSFSCLLCLWLLRLHLLGCSLLGLLFTSLNSVGLPGGDLGGFLTFSRFCRSSRPLLSCLFRLLLGLLEGKATELEGGLLEGEPLFLLLAILASGWGTFLRLGRCLPVCDGWLLVFLGLGTLYFLTFFFWCLFSGSASIGLYIGFVGILCSWRGISVGLGMPVLLGKVIISATLT